MISEHTTKLFLREWRQLKRLTQDELAERLNTSKSVISELENGKKTLESRSFRRIGVCFRL
jgi:transcriptional regulator with XRE-family HTH domain